VAPDVVLDQPAHLPDEYVPDDAAKLDLYRRLARTVEPCEIAAVRAELRDRFGPLPAAAERLLLVTELRALGARVGLDTVLVRGDEARLAQLAARVKGMPLQGDNLTRLADVWIDYALFGQALAVGQRFDDTATLTRTMWPAISQLRWDRFHERLVSGRGTLTVAQVDS